MSDLLVQIYFGYALAIGITSNRMVGSIFKQTCFSRCYALVVNIATLVLTPPLLWESRNGFRGSHSYPKLILITFHVRYLVAYAVILYTVLSRGFRDRALKEVQPLLIKLMHEEKRINWKTIAKIIFLGNALNILEIVPMGYFLALWHIASGYNFVNQRLDAIMASTPVDLEELQNIWSLHAALTRTAKRVNKIYGLQMLANRFDNFIYGVINAYWGTFFTFDADTNFVWVVIGSVTYWIRCVDSYLIDHMSDLVMRYQNSPKHAWSERCWSQELSSYVIYQNSMNLNLKVCGLFPANRKQWLNMMGAILCHSVMLLQYHLMMSAKQHNQ
ncbi:GL10777 [Drosophila persimilis]|uniref:Gustatory receptor n=1 Tax=Drosophila persimilis TaxID=7234 RepID=B4GA26_DROPE|nr:GL10777 [Drosophila persimilis]